MKLLFIAVISSIALAGCNMAHQQTGAIGGAVVGGLLGNTIGSGSGKMVATAVGTMLGTIAGSLAMKRPSEELEEDQ